MEYQIEDVHVVDKSKLKDKDLQRIFNIIKQLSYEMKEAQMPQVWRDLNIKIKRAPAAKVYANYDRTDDVIILNISMLKSDKVIMRTLSHEMFHRVYTKFLKNNPSIIKRTRKAYDYFLNNNRTPFELDDDWWEMGEEEFYVELASHIVTYTDDPKYKFWVKIFNQIMSRQ